MLRPFNLRSTDGVGSSTLPVATVAGITAGGAVLLFAVLAVLARFCAGKREDIRERKRQSTFEIDQDVHRVMRSAHPPKLDLTRSRPLSYNPFRVSRHNSRTDFWLDDDFMHSDLTHQKMYRPSNTFFGNAGDSWPLINLAKSPTLPVAINEPTIHPSAATIIRPSSSPLLETTDGPTLPQRSYSQRGRSDAIPEYSAGSVNTMGRVDADSTRSMLMSHRRSTSDNQLSSILRSTSQRLRDAAGRRPLSRAMSTLSQSSGAPPTQKLPTPPKSKNTESKEGLIDLAQNDRPGSALSYTDSVKSSLFDIYTTRTPSPGKEMPWSADDVKARPESPVNAFMAENDSFFRGKTPWSAPGCRVYAKSKSKGDEPMSGSNFMYETKLTLLS
jgi:hypothetical protein